MERKRNLKRWSSRRPIVKGRFKLQLENEMTEKDMSCKSPSKKAGIATLIAYKADFKECTLVLIRRILYKAKGSTIRKICNSTFECS